MHAFSLFVILLIWLIGTLARVYREAHYFQIEEYMIPRYLRWWLSRRTRFLPFRPTIIALTTGGAVFLLAGEDASSPASFLGAVGALIAVWPPPTGEVKKPFRRTPRATRLLVMSLGVALFDVALYSVIAMMFGLTQPDALPGSQLAVVTVIGIVLYLSAPLILVSGALVADPVEAFFRRRYIAQARSVMNAIQPTVIGVTGSYGKTTTKHFMASILNGRWRAYPTPKSYNTMMGICLAINTDLADDYSVDYFIVEMGAYIRGEIARICDLTPPDIGVVVEVGPQHLERFGSLENTAEAKYELIKALPPDGLGLFNWDNDYVRAMYERGYPQNRIAVSRALTLEDAPPLPDGPRFIATDITETLDGLTFTITDRETNESAQITAPLPGEHNVTNLLLAAALAVHQGMPLRDVAFRARMLTPPESRLVRHTLPNGITIINDAYSANPAGVVSALKALSLHQTGKRLVITPGMIELGPLHETENRRLGEIAAEHATDVILVGMEQTRPIRAGLEAAGFPAERLHVMETLSEAVAWYQGNLSAGDTVLFLNDLPDTY